MSVSASARPAWMPAPEDEFPHTPPDRDDLPWKDTWLFPMRDPSTGVVLTIHMTVSPNRSDTCRTSIVVVDGNRRVLDVRRGALTAPDGTVGNDLAALEISNPSWDAAKRLCWRGGNDQVRFEVDVEGVHPATEIGSLCPGMMPRSERNALHHVDQWVRFSGWIQWSGESRRPLRGETWRDRSWGWRKSDTSLARGWIAAFGRITDGPSFGVLSFAHADVGGDVKAPLAGWVVDDGGVRTATRVSFLRKSTGHPESIELDLTDGQTVRLESRRHQAEVIYSFHDADPGGSGWAVQGVDYFTEMVDQHGHGCQVVADYGTPFLADAFRQSTLVPGLESR